jgi:hypothetical protein
MLTTYLPCLKNKGFLGLIELVKDVDLFEDQAGWEQARRSQETAL